MVLREALTHQLWRCECPGSPDQFLLLLNGLTCLSFSRFLRELREEEQLQWEKMQDFSEKRCKTWLTITDSLLPHIIFIILGGQNKMRILSSETCKNT